MAIDYRDLRLSWGLILRKILMYSWKEFCLRLTVFLARMSKGLTEYLGLDIITQFEY